MNPKAIYPDKVRFNFTGTTNVQSQVWKFLVLITFTSLELLEVIKKYLQHCKDILTFSASKGDRNCSI